MNTKKHIKQVKDKVEESQEAVFEQLMKNCLISENGKNMTELAIVKQWQSQKYIPNVGKSFDRTTVSQALFKSGVFWRVDRRKRSEVIRCWLSKQQTCYKTRLFHSKRGSRCSG